MIALLMKATLAMAIALLLTAAARHARASLRHLILSALFAFLLILPAVQWIAPSIEIETPAVVERWQLPVDESEIEHAQTAIAQPAPAEVRNELPVISWTARAVAAYATIASLLLAWLAIGVLRLRRLAADGEVWLDGTARMNEIALAANIRRSALVLLSHRVAVPLTFGLWRSTIVLPTDARDWSADELTSALRHELEHVRREDWLSQLAARVACALYWPHPLVWIAWRRLCLEAERTCDDAVIGTSEATAYAGQLVALARNVRRITTIPALGMVSRSKLAQRVDAILDPRQPRGPHGSGAFACALALLLVLLVGLAPAKLIAAASEAVQDGTQELHELAESIERRESLDGASRRIGELVVELAKKGDNDSLAALFADGVDVNMVVPGDGTALIGAASAGRISTVDFLLARGADPNLVCLGDGSPLIAAAAFGRTTIVHRLLDAGAKIDEIVPGDENALMNAAEYGREEVVRLLLARGADPNARAYERGILRTALRRAREHGHDQIAAILISAGAKE